MSDTMFSYSRFSDFNLCIVTALWEEKTTPRTGRAFCTPDYMVHHVPVHLFGIASVINNKTSVWFWKKMQIKL